MLICLWLLKGHFDVWATVYLLRNLLLYHKLLPSVLSQFVIKYILLDFFGVSRNLGLLFFNGKIEKMNLVAYKTLGT